MAKRKSNELATPVENASVQDTVIEKSSKKKTHQRVSDFKVYGGDSTSKIMEVLKNQDSNLSQLDLRLGFRF